MGNMTGISGLYKTYPNYPDFCCLLGDLAQRGVSPEKMLKIVEP